MSTTTAPSRYPFLLATAPAADADPVVLDRTLSREQARDLARVTVYLWSERRGHHLPADFVILDATTRRQLEIVRVP